MALYMSDTTTADTCSTCHTCSTCRYWVPNDEPQGITSVHGWGECHRGPPSVVGRTVTSGDARARVTIWPITTGEQWCGDHKTSIDIIMGTGKPPSPPAT